MVLIVYKGGLHKCATYNKKFPVFFLFSFPSINAQPKRLERFCWLMAQKTLFGGKDVPFGGQNNIVVGSSGSNPKKTHIFLTVIGNCHYKVAKRQTAITFEPINGNE
jgi:hypothetical protein